MFDLQQLIDAPFAGQAEKILRSAGLWKEEALMDGVKLFSVKVKVSGTYEPELETEYVTVSATTASQAMDMAADLCGFDHVEDTEVVSASEATP